MKWACSFTNTIQKNLNEANWLHSRTRPKAWDDWKTEAFTRTQIPDKTHPQNEQYFDHFFYTLQAAQNQLGIAIGSTPLVSDDLTLNRLIAPFGMEPTGCDYVLLSLDGATQDPRVEAFNQWLIKAMNDTN